MKVLKKQKVSKMCLICGVENDKGLKANFYEMENGQLVALFNSPSEFQSYPDRMHGGMISAILDETIGRTIWIHEPDCWGVTIDLQIKYRNPVPVNEPLMAIAEMTESKSRIFKGSGIIAKMDGTVLAEGKGIFYKIKLDQIDANSHEGEAVFFAPDDVKEIAIEHIKLKKT